MQRIIHCGCWTETTNDVFFKRNNVFNKNDDYIERYDVIDCHKSDDDNWKHEVCICAIRDNIHDDVFYVITLLDDDD